ncbi:hypothetical protein HIM_05911 [Hirsutella minnesotensis 3608]|uniref:Ig-like domain-containing protein n=1 Tax=Hirsutella minnesotensis 3608 TaxID=1043627 RepID=A0A0F8A566_9HYPO|nr:hypothetical protein HIM_05911 [Hirsutella minnesotensis 3608]
MKYSLTLTALTGVALATTAEVKCPAPGSTDSQGRYSCNPAHQYPNGQNCINIEGCYFLCNGNGKPIETTTMSPVPEPTTAACPAPGSTDSQGRYSCNPAHQYPNGQTCDLVGGCYFLNTSGKPIQTTTTASSQPSAAACPAPGSTDSQGRYSCNPAHQYPNGQTCINVEGCYFLCNGNGKPIQTTTTAPSQPSATACPAPGSTDSQGRYSCNPAHQYPNGQTCINVEGCYFLCSGNGKPIQTTTTASSQPSATACPAPGSTDSQGRYSCNPAHQYPNGQTCINVEGCYFLCSGNGKPIQTTTTTPSQPSAACPAPGSTDSQGRYSCNPAHQYPEGQTCKKVGDCFFLCGGSGKPIQTTTASSQPTPSACPAPGSTDSQGRYSCNPAHQYPNGQTCDLVGGCYFLNTSGKPAQTTVSSAQPKPTAACPAPGSTDNQGRYSCNPAHQYPNGQTCDLVGGCYFLNTSGKPAQTTIVSSAQPKPSASCPAAGSKDSQGRYSCNPAHQYPGNQVCRLVGDCYVLTTLENKSPKTNSTTEVPVTAGAATVRAGGAFMAVALAAFL